MNTENPGIPAESVSGTQSVNENDTEESLLLPRAESNSKAWTSVGTIIAVLLLGMVAYQNHQELH